MENKLMTTTTEQDKQREITDPVIVFLQKTKTGNIKLVNPKGEEYILDSKNAYKEIENIVNDVTLPKYTSKGSGSGDPFQDLLNYGIEQIGPGLIDSFASRFKR